ncbi:MAG: hypothetical protein KKE20_02415, partial [Nanoarchaeota archaeon]|nr:hypothetical protein [Nanoarchaeota archaeon]
MQRPIEWFINKKLLMKDRTVKNLAGNYMRKARNNIITMNLMKKAIEFRDVLGLPADYDPNEWVVISGYYSMYMAALGILARLGYKSKNHTATILALETLLVKKRLLEGDYLIILKRVKIKKEEIEELDRVRDKREIAQ